MSKENKKIEVRKSNIHGSGVIAKTNIKKGELVTFVKGPIKKKINLDIKDVFDNPDWVGISKFSWIDPEPPCKYLNHSCEANTGLRGMRSLRAIRDIQKDEEITIDYSTIEADDRWQMECQCKSKVCRKTIRSIQFLPKRNFNSYLPNIPYRLKRLYYRI